MTWVVTTLVRTNETVVASLEMCHTSPGSPFSLLIVGTDRRPKASREQFPATSGPFAEPGRADAIVLAVGDPVTGRINALSVPRAIGVEVPVVGYQRLGWALDYGGASALVTATKRLLDVPIHHYISVDFQGFAAVVDAVGGIQLNLEHAVLDRRTGLDLPAGDQHVDGDQALAFVRSRYQETACDGRARTTSLGDGSRRDRLREVAEALVARLRHGVGPVALVRLAVATGRHLVVDESLVRRLRADPDLVSLLTGAAALRLRITDLPTRPVRAAATLRSPFPPNQVCGAAYLELDPELAEAMLEPVRDAVGRPAPSEVRSARSGAYGLAHSEVR